MGCKGLGNIDPTRAPVSRFSPSEACAGTPRELLGCASSSSMCACVAPRLSLSECDSTRRCDACHHPPCSGARCDWLLAAVREGGKKKKHFVQEKDRGSIGGARIRTPPRERRATGARAAMFNMCRRATFPHWTAGWTTE